jgi:transcriptional regulator with XRE-family HTH domain
MNYGKMINQLRINRMKQTQSVFAECVGITQSYLSGIENGSKKPSTDLLEKIAKHTELPMPILFWFSITEKDVPEDKKEYFNSLKPTADALINSFFN